MANQEHVEIVKRGEASILEWRGRNPNVRFDLSGADLSEADLSGANLSDANLFGANLRGADLRGANLLEADLIAAFLSDANLGGADLFGADLGGADLGGANLSGANLSRANLSGANLSRAHLTGAHLTGANLRGANLSDAFLRDANLSRADLSVAYLSEVDFVSGTNVSETNLSRADLRGANLSEANLSNAILSGANVSEANFSRANLFAAGLTGANFRGVQLSGANLSNAIVSMTNLREADLREAQLGEANLSMANLSMANLSKADLSGANLSETDLQDATVGGNSLVGLDLKTAKGLATARHHGPSTLAVDTLTKSEGAIPDEFLRGCGFTPWQILLAKLFDPALTAAEITDLQYKIFDARAHGPIYLGGVFISHSHADSPFVQKLHERLKQEGAPVWLDRHEMFAGPAQEQIERGIRLNDVVLLVLSATSIESDWVTAELAMARQKAEVEKRDVLCPVTLEPNCLKEMKPRNRDAELWQTVEKMNAVDFSKWQDDGQFEKQFDKLLRGLKIWYEPKKD